MNVDCTCTLPAAKKTERCGGRKGSFLRSTNCSYKHAIIVYNAAVTIIYLSGLNDPRLLVTNHGYSLRSLGLSFERLFS